MTLEHVPFVVDTTPLLPPTLSGSNYGGIHIGTWVELPLMHSHTQIHAERHTNTHTEYVPHKYSSLLIHTYMRVFRMQLHTYTNTRTHTHTVYHTNTHVR